MKLPRLSKLTDDEIHFIIFRTPRTETNRERYAFLGLSAVAVVAWILLIVFFK